MEADLATLPRAGDGGFSIYCCFPAAALLLLYCCFTTDLRVG
jgi:hypothetical protein